MGPMKDLKGELNPMEKLKRKDSNEEKGSTTCTFFLTPGEKRLESTNTGEVDDSRGFTKKCSSGTEQWML